MMSPNVDDPRLRFLKIGFGLDGLPAPPPPMLDLEPFFAAQQRGLRAAAEAQAHYWQRMAALSQEMFTFADQRLRDDRTTARSIADSGTPTEFMTAMTAFWHQAWQAYIEEMSRFGALYADQARQAIADAERQVDELVEPARPEG